MPEGPGHPLDPSVEQSTRAGERTTNLRESEEKYRALVEGSLQGVVIAQTDPARLSFANPAMAELTGYDVEELLAMEPAQLAQLIHPDDREAFFDNFRRRIAGEDIPRHNEYRVVRANGDMRWVQALSSPIAYGGTPAVQAVFVDITERKDAEAKLRLQALVLNQIQDRITVTDLNGVITWVNEAELRAMGYTQDELVGASVEKYGEDSDRGATQAEILERTLAEGLWRGEVVNYAADGSEVIMDCRTQVVRDENGKPVALAGMATDITERKRMQETLADQKRRLDYILRGTNVGTWEWNVQTGETVFSERWAEIIGYTLDEISPVSVDTWIAFCHPDDLQKSNRLLQACFNGESEYYHCECRMRHKNGEWIWVLDRGKVTTWTDDGKPEWMYGTHQEITERKRAETERERLMSAINQAAEIIVITDTDGIIEYVNPAFTRITGYTPEEVMGQGSGMLKSGEHDAGFYRDLWDTIARGDVWRGRIVNRKKDGTLYTEEAAISPVRDETGHTVNYVAVNRDITAELALEEQLLQVRKMESIGRLAGGVAHDFNNMLGGILGYAEMALGRVEPGQSLHRYLEQILKITERSAGLTQQLLAFARKQTIMPRVLNLNESVTDLLKMLRRLVGENVSLDWRPGVDLWPVRVDPGQINQVLTNLCVNARDAASGIGRITIETANVTLDEDYCSKHPDAPPGDYVSLVVSDTGRGMDADTLAHAFDPFYTTKEVGEGTGLGLSTVHGIVKQNHGLIDIQSAPGSGTTVIMHLPRHQGEAESRPEPAAAEAVAGGRGTILLVEDDNMLLDMSRQMLGELGYDVLAAGTAEEAIALATEHAGNIDALLTDVIMPEMNGRDLANRLDAICPGMETIFMSGYPASAIARHGVLDDGVDFLQKPVSMSALDRKLREALGTSS